MVSDVAWEEATNPPTYSEDGINGLPCMVGNSSNMRIISTEAAAVAPMVGISKPWTAIVAMEQTGSSGTIFGFGNSGASTPRGGLVAGNGGLLSGSIVDDSGATNLAINDRLYLQELPACVVALVNYGASYRHFVNTSWRGDLTPCLTGQMTPNRLGLFCRPSQSPGLFSGAKLGCALFYGRALPDRECLSIIAGLMGRWNIRS
jgi:hypothetical protein